MKLSNYSLNYGPLITQGKMDVLRFLSLCRQLEVEGASLHLRNLAGTGQDELKLIRRAYLDQGLSLSMVTVTTDFGRARDGVEAELDKARAAIRMAAFLGAPLLRIFAGSPSSEAEREKSFERAAQAVRKLCDEAAVFGLPIGLQNHNHGALCRTGDEVLRFFQRVNHPNLTLVLDCGQFAGSRGASGQPPEDLKNADYLASIRQTVSLARYVRAKFYNPTAAGSEPFLDYDRILDLLRSVHYSGFVDIVYEPGGQSGKGGEDVLTAVPRVVRFLRSKLAAPDQRPAAAGDSLLANDRYFEGKELRQETSVAFLEGPVADAAGQVYFSNIQAERIMLWNPSARRLSVFREKSNRANGLRLDRQGRLLACEADRVTRTDLKTGETAVLAARFEGQPIGGPNDLELDGQGRVYFTSRFGGTKGPGQVNAVYRIDPDGKLNRILAEPAIEMPNGIATSPDDRVLYVIDSAGGPQGARRIRAYDLRSDGTAANERLLYDFFPGRGGDGMKVDEEGNLYVAAGLHRMRNTSETLATRPGVHVITPAGKRVAFLETPEDLVTNLAFGGPDLRTLYITCGKLLLSVRTRVPGKAAYRV